MLLNYTIINPNLTAETAVGDHASLLKGTGSPIENLIEFAGRVCYYSTDKMGHNPTFNQQRIKEGHTDLLEHGYATVCVGETSPFFEYLEGVSKTWTDPRRFCVVEKTAVIKDQYLVTTNLRNWLHLFHVGLDPQMLPRLFDLAPSLFLEYPEGEPLDLDTPYPDVLTPYFLEDEGVADPRMARQRVALLARSNLINQQDGHLAATFLIEGVSRSLTHQLVRHRLSSISQESQRYVDAGKGKWRFVVPPSFQMDYDDQRRFLDVQAVTMAAYEASRRKGYLKEDARYYLTNAVETRLLVTAPLHAWKHFLAQRMDKAAQWEIRCVAGKICKLLVNHGFPGFTGYYTNDYLQKTA